jgi:hypothetical protein
MKKMPALLALVFFLSACDTFLATPQPAATWIVPPSRTPNIVTATPVILSPFPPRITQIAPVTVTGTEIPSSTPTETPLPPTEPTSPPSTWTAAPSVEAVILGCNTSIDITHGMGEVTNAFVIVKNTGTVNLLNACALLRAIDEDRQHPDKKKCVAELPAGNQTTLKLTVDSAYRQNTIIQVDVTSNDVILLRVDNSSCRDIGLFGGIPTDLGAIKPIQ